MVAEGLATLTRIGLRRAILLAIVCGGMPYDLSAGPISSEYSEPPLATPSANLIQMNRIAVLPVGGDKILTKRNGLDFDHDGKREFVVGERTSGPDPFHFYECTSDDTFALVHQLFLENGPTDSYYPVDAGDIDDDGLSDLAVNGKDNNMGGSSDYGARIVESATSDGYPTEMVWSSVPRGNGWCYGPQITDMDGDGRHEVVIAEPIEEFVAYEYQGTDSTYIKVATVPWGPNDLGQSFAVLDDLDGDGKKETCGENSDDLRHFNLLM